MDSEKRELKRNMSKDDFNLLIEAAEKITSEEALKNNEFLMQPDKIIKLKTNEKLITFTNNFYFLINGKSKF